MKSALVTGSNGFCGRAMTRFLVERGIATSALDRRHFYDPARLGAGPCANTVAASLAGLNPDIIFHLIGTSHASNNGYLYEANFLTTLALFEALRRHKLRPTVVVCGSAAEYGRISPSDLPLSENFAARPVDGYGASKYAQTNLALLAAQTNFPVIISRPFNIIGAHMPERLALGNFLRQLALSMPARECTLRVGNIHTSRDFITVEDAVRAWWELSQTPGAFGRIVNLCSGAPMTIGTLLGFVEKASPIPVKVASEPELIRSNDMPVHFGDNRLLRHLLGWAPPPPDFDMIGRIVRLHLAPSCAPSS